MCSHTFGAVEIDVSISNGKTENFDNRRRNIKLSITPDLLVNCDKKNILKSKTLKPENVTDMQQDQQEDLADDVVGEIQFNR